MRITKTALAISLTSVLFLSACSSAEDAGKASEEVTKTTTQEEKTPKEEAKEKKNKDTKTEEKETKKPKPTPLPKSKSLNLSPEEKEDAQVCSDLRDEMTEMMLTSAEGAADIPSMFGNFSDTDEFIEIAQEANNPDITQDAEDFAVMMKAFANYVNMGGSMDDLESPENLRLFEDAIMELEGDEIFRMIELSQELMSEQREAGDEAIAYEPFETCASLGVPFDGSSGL